LEETEIAFENDEEEPIVLKPKPVIVFSDKKVIIKKK